MKPPSLAGLVAFGFLAIALGASNGVAAQPAVAPARSGDIAIRQEFEAARRMGTRAAYDLFIARHGNHSLAKAAKVERARLPAELR
jgi:hypothetical protein